jgi:hypothetical protein
MKRAWRPSWQIVETELLAILDQLLAWQTGSQDSQPHGANAYNNSVFYQWYWIGQNPPVVGAGNADHVVPSIDNAFLAASLITLRAYGTNNQHDDLAQKADAILRNMDFLLWYDPVTHRFNWGGPVDPMGGTWADYYSNENRIINFIARALGHLTTDEYQASLSALIQYPAIYDRGTPDESDDVLVQRVAWDGSYFTYAAPGLFIREIDTPYAEDTLFPATWAQITYASAQGYPVWGLSDCFSIRDLGYVQQGAPPTGMSGLAESYRGLVTPHASAMALVTPYRNLAISNLANILQQFPESYDAMYGFYDSLLVNTDSENYGAVSDRFSALAQEWMFLSIVNAEISMIWDYFYQDSGVVEAHNEMSLFLTP